LAQAPKTGIVQARRLIRRSLSAALATTLHPAAPAPGWPYASLVLSAADHDGAPLLLLSALAEHSRNLLGDDGRMALLFDGTAGLVDPLEGARLTLLGRAERALEPRQRARFLARHPTARTYASFGDFSLYRIAPTHAHLVAGFGRIEWLEGAILLLDAAPFAELIAAEPDIIAHMNQDHTDALLLYATRLCSQPAGPWRMTGIDAEGCDLRAGALSARVDFESPPQDAAAARRLLVDLVEHARNAAPAKDAALGA
jgi:hypothetical protein